MNAMTARQWANEYLDALPGNYRVHPGDDRLRSLARTAVATEWPPNGLATAVADAMRHAGSVGRPDRYALGIAANIAARPPGDYMTPEPPELAAAPDAWRASLPRESWPGSCGHQNAVALGLSPNQCRACRYLAGDPESRPPHPGYLPPRGEPTPYAPLCPTCRRHDRQCAHRRPMLPPDVSDRAALLRELATVPVSDADGDSRSRRMSLLTEAPM